MLVDDVRALLKMSRETLMRLGVLESQLGTIAARLSSLEAASMQHRETTQGQHEAILKLFHDQTADILSKLVEIERAIIPAEAAQISFLLVSDGTLTEVSSMQLKVDKQAQLKMKVKDIKGNDAQVDGVPAWALTDPALGSLEVDADGMGAKFIPAGPVGSLMVQVSADADLGEGVKSIMGELPIDLLPGEAAVIELSGEVV